MSDILHIRAVPLAAAAFAPFGDVITAGQEGKTANQGTATRFDWAARLENARADAKPNLAVFRSMPQAMPFSVKLLEHHPHSSQAYLPLQCGRYLVVVARTGAGGSPELASIAAFVGEAGQGINYHRGVWHHPIIALDAPAELAMLAWEDGTAGDCVEYRIDPPRIVQVD